MYSAINSFPTPVSPMIRTEESEAAIVSTLRMIDRITSLPARRAMDWTACMRKFRVLSVQGTFLGGASQPVLSVPLPEPAIPAAVAYRRWTSYIPCMSADGNSLKLLLEERRLVAADAHRRGATGFASCAVLTAAMDEAVTRSFLGLPAAAH